MNRKTNIFYNSISEDSKFLTFNNYTEALTGDILAIDYKLWPSRFLGIYIDNIDKNDFILKLQRYYENKLTTLRDNIDDVSILKPLNYLIIFLYWYAYNSNPDNEYQSPYEIEQSLCKGNIDLNLVNFNYISDIVEQQYNGTYSDIICTINPSKWSKPILTFKTEEDLNFETQVSFDNNEFLYGWENESENTIEKLGDNIKYPIEDFSENMENDSTTKYFYNVESSLDKIEIEEVINPNNKLKFNLIIPLFNVINTENHYDISNDDTNITSIELNNKVNIPLGIYFTDNPIELTMDGKFSTNWSLLISTQFSAFPFSYDIQQNFDDSTSTKNAYLTFAEILANQTNFIDALTKYDDLIKSLQKRISMLENKINNISSVQNIDNISQTLFDIQKNQTEFINDINNKISTLENQINESKLKWHITTKNNSN